MSSQAKKAHSAKRDLYTPEPVQDRVIERYMRGESMRKIAKEEQIDRSTVYRILTQDEVTIMMAQLHSRAMRLGYKANDVYEEALDSGDLRIATPVATNVLQGIGVLGKGGLRGMIENAKTRKSDDDYDDDEEDDVVWPPEGTLAPELVLIRKKPPNPQLSKLPLDSSAPLQPKQKKR